MLLDIHGKDRKLFTARPARYPQRGQHLIHSEASAVSTPHGKAGAALLDDKGRYRNFLSGSGTNRGYKTAEDGEGRQFSPAIGRPKAVSRQRKAKEDDSYRLKEDHGL